MAGADIIDLKSTEHGWYQTRLTHLDEMIRKHGQKTPGELTEIIREIQGDQYYGDVVTVAEGLFILAELSGYATN